MYNITGWSNGGRRPLSYNLMPGQFRNTRVNVFSNPTIINNNIGGFGGCYDYYDDCCCGGSSNKMSWMDWTMMGGMLLNGLGNMFACFWGGGGGGSKTDVDVKVDLSAARADVKALKEQYPDAKISVMHDGTFMLNGEKYDTIDEVIDALKTPAQRNNGSGAIDTRLQGAESTAQGLNTKFHAKIVDGVIKYYSDDNPNNLVDNLAALTTPTVTPASLTEEQLNTKKAGFAELFNTAYITTNFQTTGEHAGKLKVGEKYFDNVTDAYKEYVNSRQNGSGTEVISGINAMNDLADIFGNDKTISVIDDSDIGDLTNKSISNFNSTNGTVTIGGRNYSIEIKGNGKYVYLTDTTAGTSNKQVYILEKASNGKYQISQRQDIAFVDATAGWNKAATS